MPVNKPQTTPGSMKRTHPADRPPPEHSGTRQSGVVLHQPLNCSDFRKKRVFCQNMNGPPVCLAPKTENAPTWRSPNPLFGTRFLGLFCRFLYPTDLLHHNFLPSSPNPQPTSVL